MLVVDPAVRPWTVLMMRRPSGARFAAGAWAFPGGAVDPGDRSHPDPCRAAAARELREEMGLRISPAEGLVYVARWITPEASPVRFDCRFYLTRRPEGQDVAAHAGEVAEWRWVTPRQILDDPEATLIHVTRRLLEQVDAHRDVEVLIDLLRDRPETPPVLPRLIRGADGGVVRIEDDAAPLPDPPR